MKPNSSLRGVKYLKLGVLWNMEEPPNNGTNLHNWVLGFTSKKINSNLQQKRIYDEILILGISSVCLDSTSQAKAKSAHKGAKMETYLVEHR
jgi:hypothetical protein